MRSQQLVLYIEGESSDANGDLREGFSSLFSQKLTGKMPRIRMSDSKPQAIAKFKKPLLWDEPLLIIDLDENESSRSRVLNCEGLDSASDKVFFMVQEMEAWFLSQPEILDNYFGFNISNKIRRKPAEIKKPSDELYNLTKLIPGTKGRYHKVRDGVALLKRLNLDKLMKEFRDVNQLINFILNK